MTLDEVMTKPTELIGNGIRMTRNISNRVEIWSYRSGNFKGEVLLWTGVLAKEQIICWKIEEGDVVPE